MYLETKATFTSLPSCLKRKQKKKLKREDKHRKLCIAAYVHASWKKKNKTIVYVLVSIAHNITRINTLYKQKAKSQWIKRFLADQQ